LFDFILKFVYESYLRVYYPKHYKFLTYFNQLLDDFWNDIKINCPDYTKQFNWDTLKAEFIKDFSAYLAVDKWTTFHNIFIKLEDRQRDALKDMLVGLFRYFIIEQKQIRFKYNDLNVNVGLLSHAGNYLDNYPHFKNYFENNPPIQLLISLKTLIEGNVDYYLSNELISKWYIKMIRPTNPVIPESFQKVSFEGLTIQKTPQNILKGAVYKNAHEKKFLIKKSSNNDVLANLIASHIGQKLCKHFVPVEYIYSKENQLYISQPFLASLKSLLPRRFDFITARISSIQLKKLKSKLANQPSLLKDFCEILATSFAVSDLDVHLGNIVVNDNKLYKIDHAWGLDGLGRLDTLSLFRTYDVLRYNYQNRIAPSNGFSDFKFIMHYQVFFASLQNVAHRLEETLDGMLKEIDTKLTKMLSQLDYPEKAEILDALMNRLGGQFHSKISKPDVLKKKILSVLEQGLKHRIHGMRLIAMSAQLVHIKDEETLNNKLHTIQKYCLTHDTDLALGRKLIPIEAQSYIKNALYKLALKDKKCTCFYLKDLFKEENKIKFNFYKPSKSDRKMYKEESDKLEYVKQNQLSM